MRRVFYDAGIRAAARAASLLAGEFDVRELAGAPLSDDGGAVVLVGDTPRVGPDPRRRIVAFVADVARGPWPDDWYAVLPEDVSRPVLARTARNAFADLDSAAKMVRLARELSELNGIGIQLSAERDPRVLLDTILRKAREITHSDAGSLYLVEEAADGTQHLRFALTQNDSMPVPFRAATLPLTRESVAGYVALEGTALNLEDAYTPPPGSPFRINRSFDDRIGYRTKSMLVVPMQTPKGEIAGVLQLINCKPSFDLRLTSPDEMERLVQPFGARYETLASSLASQAAVALDNSRLYQSIQRLFEGFVRASVVAIESRDPVTSGHSFRVADLTVALAEIVNRSDRGAYGDLRFSADELMELRYAALLHDFGKIGVREQVLTKAKKLFPDRLETIRHRIDLIKRGFELRVAERKLALLERGDRRRYAEAATKLDAELAARVAELDAHLARVIAANEPSVVTTDVTGIEALAEPVFEDHLGRRQSILTADEATTLAIARGSLTPDEYREIQSHVVHTFQFLAQIPWTREFRRIPDIARLHHEKLNGSGYPDGVKAEDIPVQARIMTIADMYDALTIGDRPYKGAVPVDEALDILREERRGGALDSDLLDLFIEAKVYERALRG